MVRCRTVGHVIVLDVEKFSAVQRLLMQSYRPVARLAGTAGSPCPLRILEGAGASDSVVAVVLRCAACGMEKFMGLLSDAWMEIRE